MTGCQLAAKQQQMKQCHCKVHLVALLQLLIISHDLQRCVTHIKENIFKALLSSFLTSARAVEEIKLHSSSSAYFM